MMMMMMTLYPFDDSFNILVVGWLNSLINLVLLHRLYVVRVVVEALLILLPNSY